MEARSWLWNKEASLYVALNIALLFLLFRHKRLSVADIH